MSSLKPGDTPVVWRLDRLGLSMRHLVPMIEELRENNIGFKSISGGAIDTTIASGELIFNIFSALAQFEWRFIQERTKAGLASARARGKVGGRKPIVLPLPKIALAKKFYADKSSKILKTFICTTLQISKSTLYRYLKMKSPRQLKCRQTHR